MKTKTYTKEINIPELKDFSTAYPQFAGLAKSEGKFLFEIAIPSRQKLRLLKKILQSIL